VDVPGGGYNSVANKVSRNDVSYLIGVSTHAPHETNTGGRYDTRWTVKVVDPPGDRFIVGGYN